MIPKFRAWLKSVGEMVEVLEIDFYNKEVAYIWNEQVSDYELEQTREVDGFNDVELMQSTVLKDKKGVEVYEGDIVKFDARSHYHPEVYAWEYETKGVGIIRYEMGSYLLGGREESHILETLFGILMNYEEIEIEVIGNIHENKELIEKVKSRNIRPF